MSRNRVVLGLMLALTLPSILSAQEYEEYYGSRGGYVVALNVYGACVAVTEISYSDIYGEEYPAAIAFGVLEIEGRVGSMLGLSSASFSMTMGDARRGTISFDASEYEAFYMADSHQMFTAYMEFERIEQIMYSEKADLNLFDGTYIELPLDGTLSASELVLDCAEDHIIAEPGHHDPFSGR